MSARESYERAAATLVEESGVTVRRYRARATGIAYTGSEDWGIEAPEPRGPVSFATFAHEVGHQMLHRGKSTPRWLEEIEAWEFALDCFRRFELPGIERARADAAVSLQHAVAETLRRRCSPETAEAMLERIPAWVWSDAKRGTFAFLDLTRRASGEAS